MKKLPKKLSECLKIALMDLEKVEKDKNYFINMGEWQKPKGFESIYCGSPINKCSVCLAGSCLAKTLKYNPEYVVDILDNDDPKIGEWNCSRLRAINYLREGDVARAFNEIGVDKPDMIDNFDGVEYSKRNSKKFKKQMYQLVDILKVCGE